MAERPPGKVIVVMPAMNAARTLEQTVQAIPREWVDEIILVDDASSDDTVELARRLPLHAGLAPAQRRLRRQPEDVLPRGAAARRRRRGDAASRRPVRARADRQHGRADPGRAGPTSCWARASRVPGMALANGMPRWKYVVNRALTDGGEPDHGHRADRGPHGLPGLLAAAADDRAVPAQLGRLQLRLRAADAGGPLRHADRGGARRAGATSRRRPRWACAAASSTASRRSGRACG